MDARQDRGARAIARIATFEGERARELQQRIDLAREVHDGVVQRLFGVSLALDAGGDFPPRRAQPARRPRSRARSPTCAASSSARSAARRGRPRRRSPRSCERLGAADAGLTIEVEPAPARGPAARSSRWRSRCSPRRCATPASTPTPTRVTVRAGRSDDAFVLEVANDGVRGSGGSAATGMGLRLAAFEALQAGGFVEFGERDEGDLAGAARGADR